MTTPAHKTNQSFSKEQKRQLQALSEEQNIQGTPEECHMWLLKRPAVNSSLNHPTIVVNATRAL